MSQAVLGGGISGLSAAYYLSKRASNKVKIYESSDRLGGWIKSIRTKNGTLFEQGPRSLRCRGEASQNTLQLVEELGIESSILPVSTSSPAAKNRMIYYNNQLISLPNSLSAFVKINPPFVKPFIFGVWRDLKTPKKVVEDESVHDFVSRRFGEDYAEILCGALICGIFAGNAKEISAKAFLSDIFKVEQEYGGVIYGLLKSSKKKKTVVNKEAKSWSVLSFQNGLETLPIKMQNYLKQKDNIEVFLKRKCTAVEFCDGKVQLKINDNSEVAEHLFSSLPSKDLAKILGDEHSYLKSQLLSIPYVSVAVVNLEYEGDLIQNKGFGFLVPPNQNLPILGITYDSCIFPQEGKTVLTVMMGGRWFEQHFGSNPDKNFLLSIAEDHVKKILKINDKPVNSLVTVLKDCIPQYVVGHTKRVEDIRNYIKKNKLPLTLIGNSYDGVGVNDAILSARKGVESNMASHMS